MSHPALVAAALIVILTAIGAGVLIESDPLGVIAAGVLVAVGALLVIGVFVGDALVRSFRKARATDHFAEKVSG